MQNIDIRFNATSNFSRVKADMAALEGQATALSNSFNKMGWASADEVVNPGKWRTATNAIEASSKAYRNAASSSGLLTTQQIRANSETKRYTDLLDKQKLSFRDMIKNHGIMKDVYRDQLRMQRMTAQSWGTDEQGRQVIDVTMPKNVPAELDSWRNRIGFVSESLKSAGHEMINFGKNTQWAGRQLMVGFTVPTAMFGALAGKMAYDTDAAWTKVAKVYDTTATNALDKERELSDFRTQSMQMAEKLARNYGSAVADTLEVQQQLASQGYQGTALLGMVDQVQRISMLGDLDVDTAVNMTTSLRTAFKDTIKDTEDLAEAFDYMNATENATSLTIQDIAEAVPRAGSALASLGVDVKQMTALMVAMKSAGVNAEEGSNALKSATTRILAVVPQAEAAFSGFLNGYESVQQIGDESGGNLYVFLQKLAEATQGMDNLSRQKGIAKLFGTYQYNRLNAALAGVQDSMVGIGDESSQTFKAVELAAMSAEDAAAIAEGEAARKMNSMSGRFKAELEVIKLGLAEMGVPFLEIGTQIAGVISKIITGFNGLGEGTKKFFVIGAIVTAVFGPMIMLTGLFFNLLGHITTGVGALGKFATRWKGTTLEMKTSQVITDALNKELSEQINRTSTLEKELQALSGAYREAQAAQTAYMRAAQGVQYLDADGNVLTPDEVNRKNLPGPTNDNAYGAPAVAMQPFNYINTPGYRNLPDLTGLTELETAAINSERIQRARAATVREEERISRIVAAGKTDLPGMLPLDADKRGRFSYWVEEDGKKRRARKDEIVHAMTIREMEQARVKVAQDLDASATDQQKKAALIASDAEVTAKEQQRSARHSRAIAGAAGGMSLAFAGAAYSSGKLQTSLMAVGTAMMAVQGVQSLASMKTTSGTWMKGSATATKFGKVATGALSKVGVAAKAVGLALLGPWGIVAGVAAFSLYKIYKQMEKPEERQEAINRSVSMWADTLGVIERKYDRINLSSAQGTGDVTGYDVSQRILDTEDGKKMADEVKSQMDGGDNDAGLDMTLAQEYVKLLNQTNADVSTATRGIEGLLIAAGASGFEAADRAKQIAAMFGQSISGSDLSGLWTEQLNIAMNSSEQTIDERTTGIAEMMMSELERVGPEGMAPVLANIERSLNSVKFDDASESFMGLLDPFGGEGTDIVALFDQLQKAGNELFKAGKNVGDMGSTSYFNDAAEMFGSTAAEMEGLYLEYEGLSDSSKTNLINGAKAEKEIVNIISERLGLEEKYNTIKELQASEEYKIGTTTRANVKQRIQDLREQSRIAVDMAGGADSLLGKLIETNAVEGINRRLRKVGMTEITDLNDKINWQQLKQLEAQDAIIAKETKREAALRASLKVYKDFVKTGYAEAGKSNMTAVMSAVTDSMMDDLQSRQDAASTALDDSIDSHNDALEQKADNVEKHFDDLADKIEKTFDRRIKAINDEIDAEQEADDVRQKIYERNMARINAMVEAENRNIDFNVAIGEGNFDEAAKIFNEGIASSYQNTMEAQNTKATDRVEARQKLLEAQIELLEKRRDARLEEVDKARERATKEIDIEKDKFAKMADLRKKHLADSQEMERDQLQRELDLIMTYIPRNEEQAKKYLERMSKKYDTFGKAWKNGSIKYSDLIDKTMVMQLKRTANQLKSDVNWAGAGYDGAQGMIKGMAAAMGMAPGQFRKWLGLEVSGERPKGKKDPKSSYAPTGNAANPLNPLAVFHTGGEIGKDRGGRAGFSGGYSKHSEVPIMARKGEFMMKEGAVRKYGSGFMNAVNNGSINMSRSNVGHGIGGGTGIASGMASQLGIGMMGRMIGGSMIAMMRKGLGTAVSTKKAQQDAATGTFSVGEAGMYGGTNFGAEQLKNAAIIASVGSSMAGISKRDIQIGIMTAIAESGLINVNYGDRDSLGLFQQRPSMGWGSVAEVTNPEYAARKFFSTLKGVEGREEMSPWMAAQTVQRSAFADGSNYQQYWDEAQAIFGQGLVGTATGYAAGPGGWHRASVPGKGWSNSHDYRNGLRSPLYAVSDGSIVESRAISNTQGSEQSGAYPRGYGSYGVTTVLKTKDGDLIRYAHMWPGSNIGLGPVKGGTMIGLSASTGNSSGPHTHFEVNGSEAAQQWFQAHGIGLKTGGVTKTDGMANLHANEVVLSPTRTENLNDSLDYFTAMMNIKERQSILDLISGGNKVSGADDKPTGSSIDNANVNGDTVIKAGTYNVYAGNGVGAMKSDLNRLMAEANVLALTEMHANSSMTNFMNKKGWDMHSGNGTGRYGREATVAWNNKKYEKEKAGTRLLGNLTGDFVGGRGKRFANYALLRDRETNRKFWQVSAHTVPTVNSNAAHMALFREQYKALDGLVGDLQGSGAPVFLGGDFNQHRGNKFWREPGNLKSYREKGIDHIFSDPRFAKLLGQQQMNGLNTDHKGGGYLAQFNIPGLKTGGDIMFDDTLINAHKDEKMLTAPLSKALERGIYNLEAGKIANAGPVVYDIDIHDIPQHINKEELANLVVKKIEDKKTRTGRSRKVTD